MFFLYFNFFIKVAHISKTGFLVSPLKSSLQRLINPIHNTYIIISFQNIYILSIYISYDGILQLINIFNINNTNINIDKL